MRIPLHWQVFLPFAGLLAATITAVSVAGAWQAVQTADEGIDEHVRDAAGVLVAADFPLTDAVLAQTRGLSGAELVGVDRWGSVRATSLPADLDYRPLAAALGTDPSKPGPVVLGNVEYVHQVVERSSRPTRDGITRIHLLYPQDLRRRLLRRAIVSPIAIGGSALGIAALLSWWIAARICRPIDRVRAQFEHLAAGGGGTLPVPSRNDELRDLVGAVNVLARQLQDRDDAVRRAARSSLLGQLSGGLCHHLRNAAAGAKLALQLYRRKQPQGADELDVALRQITLSEEYLQRLLTLGKPEAPRYRAVDLRALVEDIAALTAPAFRHRGVTLHVELPPANVQAAAVDADLLRSAIVNLLTNGLDAAGEHGWVDLQLSTEAESARVTVRDGGPGLPQAVAAKLFEPFVTSKPDGIGLGLAAALRTAEMHGGTLAYRDRPHTSFELTIPLGEAAKTDAAAPPLPPARLEGVAR